MTTNYKPSLYAALDKIGHTNGHNVPASQDPAVAVLHEYMTTTLAASYFDKRRDVAKKKMLDTFNDDVATRVLRAVADTKKNATGSAVTLMDGEHYSLVLKPKIGASYLDAAKLRTTLMKDHKMSLDQVDKLMESCTLRREPSLSYEVTEK